MPLHCDNQSAIHLAENPKFYARTKHVEVHYHFVREKVLQGKIKMCQTKTKDQVADIFTKGLNATKFANFGKQLGTFATNSTYANNLYLILSSLPSNVTANGGFYNASAGQDPNKVYALALCRGDLDTGKCYTCTNTSSLEITKQCPDQNEAIRWGAECILRYSNRNIFGTMEVSPFQCVPNPNNISSTDLDQFNQTLNNLMGSLVNQASLGSSSIKYFAVGDKSFSSSRNVYGLVQCTPDISQMDCNSCL
ncbi:cysteine-rich receptor-like protein kinase 26 [Quercus suber]|uniref:cysteine-rich receptor-like protein kinase 26 n=1 Tax=Quercus suber TaxID=58331 RepID=UPI0032DE5C96